jgi:hypothetical protein
MLRSTVFWRNKPELGVGPPIEGGAAVLEQLNNSGCLLSREEVSGALRIKIVVSKHKLKNMVIALSDGTNVVTAAATSERHRARVRLPGNRAEAACGAALRRAPWPARRRRTWVSSMDEGGLSWMHRGCYSATSTRQRVTTLGCGMVQYEMRNEGDVELFMAAPP